MLVRDRWTNGENAAVLSDYAGTTLGQLVPKVEPFLSRDPSHPGKLRTLGGQLNPANHDDVTPDHSTIRVTLGELKFLTKEYLVV